MRQGTAVAVVSWVIRAITTLGLVSVGCTSSHPGAVRGDGGASTNAGGLAPVDFEEAGAGGAEGTAWGDRLVTNVRVEVHPSVKTILTVHWDQQETTDSTWLEFTLGDGNVMCSRAAPGSVGAHRDVVLGVPGPAAVAVRIAGEREGLPYRTHAYHSETGAVPRGLPRPEVLTFDPARASPERWLLGAVENSDGGCNSLACYYHATFWIYIMDRQGRIVWYYADPASQATSSFPRIARDGEYLWIDKRDFYDVVPTETVLKTTLDHEYSEEIPVDGLSDCIDVTDDGSLLYDTNGRPGPMELREMRRDGSVRTIWSCTEHFGGDFDCYSNTVNYNPRDDTVLLSFPYENTVVEIDRRSGALVGQYGDAPGSYDFSPSRWEFEFQHFPNITPEGTLLVSTHMPGYEDTQRAVAGGHTFLEFAIDREHRTLIERWAYMLGQEWAMYKGMAIRLPNGNTLANYGTGGVIREITPDQQTVFLVKFDSDRGDDDFNKMLGNNVLVDDLYSLNGGGPE